MEWARLVLRAVFSTGWGQLRRETQRTGLNVSVGRASGEGGGGQRLVESGWEGGIRAPELCEEGTEKGLGERRDWRARVLVRRESAWEKVRVGRSV